MAIATREGMSFIKQKKKDLILHSSRSVTKRTPVRGRACEAKTQHFPGQRKLNCFSEETIISESPNDCCATATFNLTSSSNRISRHFPERKLITQSQNLISYAGVCKIISNGLIEYLCYGCTVSVDYASLAVELVPLQCILA